MTEEERVERGRELLWKEWLGYVPLHDDPYSNEVKVYDADHIWYNGREYDSLDVLNSIAMQMLYGTLPKKCKECQHLNEEES